MPYANTFRPLGFTPAFMVGRRGMNTIIRPTPNVRQASAGGNASTDLAIGDAYALDATGSVYRAGPGDTVRGIVVGFVLQGNPNVMGGRGPISVDYVTGSPPSGSWPSVIGVEDAGAEFNVQADTLSQAQVGGSVNLLDAAPDAVYRQSRQSINVAGGAGTQFRIIALVQSPADNAFGANAKAVVRMLTTLQG